MPDGAVQGARVGPHRSGGRCFLAALGPGDESGWPGILWAWARRRRRQNAAVRSPLRWQASPGRGGVDPARGRLADRAGPGRDGSHVILRASRLARRRDPADDLNAWCSPGAAPATGWHTRAPPPSVSPPPSRPARHAGAWTTTSITSAPSPERDRQHEHDHRYSSPSRRYRPHHDRDPTTGTQPPHPRPADTPHAGYPVRHDRRRARAHGWALTPRRQYCAAEDGRPTCDGDAHGLHKRTQPRTGVVGALAFHHDPETGLIVANLVRRPR